ncbi:DMT family transporter [Streptomyces sp. NPDC048566]|uniref:DMT family transporter n=1 Tax=Streptomyces sp. NPDC048566 TaxID=3365569 RepID=UPI0037120D49
MSALALSVVLSFVSAVAYAGGAIVQEQVALSSPGQTYAPLRRPAWWAAIAMNGLGGLLHVVALAFGPLSLVQPLGALTIVFALPMAALFVGRKASAAAWRGAIMATVGLAGLLSLVGASDAVSLSSAQRLAVGVVAGGSVAALMVAGRAAHRHPAVRSVLLAIAAGVAFSMSSVFTKTVAVDWSRHVSLADLSSLAAIGVFAAAGMMLSQASYRGAGLEAPLATLTVVNPVVAAVVGITMFGETFRHGTTGTVLALGCGVVAAGGLILLTTARMGSDADRPANTATGPAADADDTAAARDGNGTAPERRDRVRHPAGDATTVGVPSALSPGAPAVSAAPSALASPAAAEASVRDLLARLSLPDDGSGAPGTPVPAGTTPAPLPRSGRARPAASATRPVDGAVPVPEAAQAAGTVLVPASFQAHAPAAAARTGADTVPTGGSARDELPYLTAVLGVPYVPMPFATHRRTRIGS